MVRVNTHPTLAWGVGIHATQAGGGAGPRRKATATKKDPCEFVGNHGRVRTCDGKRRTSAMLSEFFAERKKGLSIGVLLGGTLLFLKFVTPEFYQSSRYTGIADITLIFVIPAGFVWEGVDFRRKRNER